MKNGNIHCFPCSWCGEKHTLVVVSFSVLFWNWEHLRNSGQEAFTMPRTGSQPSFAASQNVLQGKRPWLQKRDRGQKYKELLLQQILKTFLKEKKIRHFWRILHSTELHKKGAKSALFIEGDISSGFQAKFKPKSSSEQFFSSTLCKLKLRFHQQFKQYNGVVTPHRRKLASSSSPSFPQVCRPTPFWLWQTLSRAYKKIINLEKNFSHFWQDKPSHNFRVLNLLMERTNNHQT